VGSNSTGGMDVLSVVCVVYCKVQVSATSWGGSTNSVEDKGQKERGSLGGTPYSGFWLNLQMSKIRILIRLLRMYFPRNWEFVSAPSKLRNFGEASGLNTSPPPPPVRQQDPITNWSRAHLLRLVHISSSLCSRFLSSSVDNLVVK
jgi:hypothetical protein